MSLEQKLRFGIQKIVHFSYVNYIYSEGFI